MKIWISRFFVMRWTWCKVSRYIVMLCMCISVRMRVFHPWFLSSRTIHWHPIPFLCHRTSNKFYMQHVKLKLLFGSKLCPSWPPLPVYLAVRSVVLTVLTPGSRLDHTRTHCTACHHPWLCTELLQFCDIGITWHGNNTLLNTVWSSNLTFQRGWL